MRHPAWSIASLLLFAYVLVLSLFGRDLLTPPPEGERVRWAFEEWREARLARRFARLYGLSSAGPLVEERAWLLGPRSHEDLAWDRARRLLDRIGWTIEEAREADAREFYVRLWSAQSAAELEWDEEDLRGLVVEGVEVDGDSAWVRCGRKSICCDRTGGRWTVRTWFTAAVWPGPLERKLAAFLPRPRTHGHVDFLVEVGPSRLRDSDLQALTACLRAGPPGAEVLVDLDPELAFADAIRVVDALLRAEVVCPLFAAPSGASVPSGVFLNGEPVAGLEGRAPPPDPDRLAEKRVIGLDPFVPAR